MSFYDTFSQCPDSQLQSNLKTLHEHLSPANEDEHIPDQYYYSSDDFNSLLKTNYNETEQVSAFTCLHFNCRSLPHNFDALTLFLSSLTLKSSVIGLTETWLNENSSLDMFKMTDYAFISNSRKSKRGGGVGMYIRNSVKYKRRPDLDAYSSSSESIFIEVDLGRQKILIGTVYRPPNQSEDDFLIYLNKVLNVVESEKKLLYLMGDFNLNLLNVGSVQYVDDFLDTMLSNSINPLIRYPTRVSPNSQTLIDNIFTNDPDAYCSGLLLTDISDHFPIFCIANKSFCNSNKGREKTVIFKRDVNEANILKFANILHNTKWDFSGLNANESYDSFLEIFLSAYDSCFPVKPIKTRSTAISAPWFNDNIRKHIKKKNRLYKLYLKNRSEYRKSVYKQIRNKVVDLIKQAKKTYYKEQFNKVKGNMKKTWNVINTALGKEKKKTVIKKVMDGNTCVTEEKKISDLFNDYFVNVGYNLNTKFVTRKNNHVGKYIVKNIKTAFFAAIYPEEISKSVKNFKSNTSSGYDDIDIKIVKKVINYICKPLSAIFSKCIDCGVFPDQLKIARVIPVFKSGSQEILTNYRPISVLPIFSKVFEKCIYNRLLSFINECNILTSNQYGFREGHSTSHALINFIRNVTNAIDNEEAMLGIFLDLSKAFDTLDHDILIYKLELYGIRGVVLDLFKSYLQNRYQFVNVNGFKSQKKLLRCGVPQGSILGPLLFLIYINDLCNTSKNLKYILFADDTSIFMSHKDAYILQKTFNDELHCISDWLYMNKLTVNTKKTNFMIFTNKKIDVNHINVRLGEADITQVPSIKFLGVTIDNKLTWKTHLDIVCNKISKNIGILYRIKFLPTNVLKMIYNAIIAPILDYGISVWGSAASSYLDRLFRLQKRAIRVVSHSPFLAHSSPIFYNNKLLTIYDMYEYQLGIFMFLCHKKLLPSSLLHYYTLNSDIHSYPTRNAANYHLPSVRTCLSQKSIIYQGPVVWNSLSDEIRKSNTLNLFKARFKRFLFSKYDN